MSKSFAPHKTELGWTIEIPAEMADAIGVAAGSLAVLHTKPQGVEIEILPPPTLELKESVHQIFKEYRETFEELKQLGD
ncbi:MAG TPA: hypothetical protein VGO73_05065 [Pyrinomonadaceae bacterium]|jgi:hypothetical protein|nr:hypothetical protein [Pyrinomonadaceae bacterium]